MGPGRVGVGDRSQAQRYAGIAGRNLPREPLTALLRAQTAQLRGDRAAARRAFEAMNALERGAIANHDENCAANYIKLTVAPDGKSYTVSIPATGHTRTFQTRAQ